MTREEIVKILRVGVLLSSERDLNRLLEQILTCVMELTRCDAGTLYLLDGGALRVKLTRNNTLGTCTSDPELPPVPLREANVCAQSLLEDRTIRIEDVYCGGTYGDYEIHSMLVVPMHTREGGRLGVLQLVNAMDEKGNIRAFSEDMALILESIASQAAITIQNVRYTREIKRLFGSFVRVMSSVIDERTPYNGSHTRHMAAYGARFIDYLNRRAAGAEPPFSPERREAILLAVWLHDIGKLVTPLEVMNKERRLPPEQHTAFTHRMEILRLRARLASLTGERSAEEAGALIRTAEELEALVERVNAPGPLGGEQLAQLRAFAEKKYLDFDGTEKSWLSAGEYTMLSIRNGTLSEKERALMREHVVITDRLLSQLDFPGEYADVRLWASSHHELLDGSGYPKGLRGGEIPVEARMITILDIFDALTADDRPYKPGMPVEEALDILDGMANREGKLDPELTGLFIESRCWEADIGKSSRGPDAYGR